MKRLLGILIALICAVTFITQEYAREIRYHPVFGEPFIFNIYSPLNFILIDPRLKAATYMIHKKYVMIIQILSFIVIFPCLYYKKKNLTVHGTSKWATLKEIKAMNLILNRQLGGVILGKFKGRYLAHNGAEHVMMMAPTRMGKGINTVLPTLYSWKDSVIVNDIKGECWEKTSGYRKEVLGQEVIMIAPLSSIPKWTYNPLDVIALRTDQELADVTAIAQTLLDLDGKGESDHWISSAINYFTGLILHVKYITPGASLTDVVKYATDPKMNIVEKMGRVIGKYVDDDGVVHDCTPHEHETTTHLFKEIYMEETKLHPKVASIFSQLFYTPEKERGSIISTCNTKLKIFQDPRVQRNTSSTSISIKELKEKKVSLYIVMPPKTIQMLRPLLRLIFTQVVYELTDKGIDCKSNEEIEFKDTHKIKEKVEETVKFSFLKKLINYFYIDPGKNKLLLLIDEFPALGKMDIFETAIPYIAGYGLKTLLITQSMNQLKSAYGDKNSILENCGAQIYLTPADVSTPKMISDMLGTYTAEIQNTSGKKGQIFGKTYTTSLMARPLLTPGEVRTLPYERLIIFVTSKAPIYGDKIFYWKDRLFKHCENYDVPTLEIKEKNDVKKTNKIGRGTEEDKTEAFKGKETPEKD